MILKQRESNHDWQRYVFSALRDEWPKWQHPIWPHEARILRGDGNAGNCDQHEQWVGDSWGGAYSRNSRGSPARRSVLRARWRIRAWMKKKPRSRQYRCG